MHMIQQQTTILNYFFLAPHDNMTTFVIILFLMFTRVIAHTNKHQIIWYPYGSIMCQHIVYPIF